MPFDDPSSRVEIDVANKEELAILDKMAEILASSEKWNKGAYVRTTRYGEIFCTMGALNKAATGYGDRVVCSGEGHAEHLVVKALRESLPNGFFHIHCFNDAPSTTHADVLNLIRRARAKFE